MRVLKLGGSLYRSPSLPDWLAMLARQQGLVLVPGGGPFADQVREAQRRWGFADACGHRMALLAMAQYGQMIAALQPGLVAVSERSELDTALARGETPVCLPGPLLDGDGLPRDWSVSSDTLALWLARKLGARALILVKSVPPERQATGARELARAGIIDAAFASMMHADPPAAVFWAGDGQHPLVNQFLENDTPVGVDTHLAAILA